MRYTLKTHKPMSAKSHIYNLKNPLSRYLLTAKEKTVL